MDYSTNLRKKDGGWQYIITYKVNGKWKTKSKQGFKGTNGKSDANKAMLQMISILEKEIKSNTPVTQMTLNSFLDTYVKDISMYKEFESICYTKKSVKAFSNLGSKEIQKITNKDIQNSIDKLTLDGLKSSTIKVYLKSIKMLFNVAKNEYNLIHELPSFKLNIKDDKEPSIKKALTSSEVDSMLDNLKDYKHYLFVLVAAKTGMRLGEICGLFWEDIDFKNNTIKIQRQLKFDGNKYILGTLKTKNSYRTIPLPQSLKEILDSIKKDEGRIFNYDNKKTLDLVINRKLKKFDITLHELRHTYATNLLSLGIDIKTVSVFMGHTLETCMKTYIHANNDMINNASELIFKNI